MNFTSFCGADMGGSSSARCDSGYLQQLEVHLLHTNTSKAFFMARVVILVGLWSITLETFFFQLILWKILFDVFQGVTLHYYIILFENLPNRTQKVPKSIFSDCTTLSLSIN